MPSVSRTELNQQTARVLARVAAGERLTITDRGRPIAEISPPTESAWDQLVREGKVSPATARGAWDFEPIESDTSSAQMIDDIRGDRS